MLVAFDRAAPIHRSAGQTSITYGKWPLTARGAVIIGTSAVLWTLILLDLAR